MEGGAAAASGIVSRRFPVGYDRAMDTPATKRRTERFSILWWPTAARQRWRWGLAAAVAAACNAGADGAEWTVPLGGNAFVVATPAGSGDGLQRGGKVVRWRDPATVFAVFFHVDRPARVALTLAGVKPGATLTATVGGRAATARVAGERAEFGSFDVAGPGYVRVDLGRPAGAAADAVGPAPALVVDSDTVDLTLSAVRDDAGGMYYWGRRGPSVHLSYRVPSGVDVEYAYCEVTVPEGEDAQGSFFMANGFAQGYLGMQVNSPTERRVLFSVWSPFSTDDPAAIPAADRVETLASGPGVRVGAFGGEGSGGQSFLVHPWRAGITYRFLTRVTPDGAGSTVYTAWFAPAAEGADGEWRLIARFRRPRTDTHLTGFHSFLENFDDSAGWIGRRARYGNQWVRDTAGTWHPVTGARFTGDATAGGGHRLDYAGGVAGEAFFLRNCGFFAERVALDGRFERPATPAESPRIDLERLP